LQQGVQYAPGYTHLAYISKKKYNKKLKKKKIVKTDSAIPNDTPDACEAGDFKLKQTLPAEAHHITLLQACQRHASARLQAFCWQRLNIA
jgi:hypothetical protein